MGRGFNLSKNNKVVNMIFEEQKKLAYDFMKLHKDREFFILANAWNVGSAYVFEKENFKAIGTSSQGMALALGYPDGQHIDINDIILVVSLMTKRVKIPVSVDIERGFSDNLDLVKLNVAKLLDIGAVGFNIEDGKQDKSLDDLQFFLEKLRVVSELKKDYDLDFVLNARTCTYWHGVGDESTRLKIAIERANAFVEAGADCVFFPGAVPLQDIKILAKEVCAPINILLTPATKDIAEIQNAGVTRLSIGSGPARSTYNYIINMARDLQMYKSDLILNHDFTYAPANVYFNG